VSRLSTQISLGNLHGSASTLIAKDQFRIFCGFARMLEFAIAGFLSVMFEKNFDLIFFLIQHIF